MRIAPVSGEAGEVDGYTMGEGDSIRVVDSSAGGTLWELRPASEAEAVRYPQLQRIQLIQTSPFHPTTNLIFSADIEVDIDGDRKREALYCEDRSGVGGNRLFKCQAYLSRSKVEAQLAEGDPSIVGTDPIRELRYGDINDDGIPDLSFRAASSGIYVFQIIETDAQEVSDNGLERGEGGGQVDDPQQVRPGLPSADLERPVKVTAPHLPPTVPQSGQPTDSQAEEQVSSSESLVAQVPTGGVIVRSPGDLIGVVVLQGDLDETAGIRIVHYCYEKANGARDEYRRLSGKSNAGFIDKAALEGKISSAFRRVKDVEGRRFRFDYFMGFCGFFSRMPQEVVRGANPDSVTKRYSSEAKVLACSKHRERLGRGEDKKTLPECQPDVSAQ